jgi:hypothetical protein
MPGGQPRFRCSMRSVVVIWEVGKDCLLVTSADFAQLVRIHTLHGFLVGLLVVLDRDLRRHSSHSVHAALVAGLDQQLHVCIHEWHRHGHGASVGKHELRVVAELLDDAENVVPASTVES